MKIQTSYRGQANVMKMEENLTFFTIGRRSRGNTPLVLLEDVAVARLCLLFKKGDKGWFVLNVGNAPIEYCNHEVNHTGWLPLFQPTKVEDWMEFRVGFTNITVRL